LKTGWFFRASMLTVARSPDYVPPKKPYSFLAMIDDILAFAAETLVDNGRLSFWMPTANDEEEEFPIPAHPYLERVAVCSQVFNKCKYLSRSTTITPSSPPWLLHRPRALPAHSFR